MSYVTSASSYVLNRGASNLKRLHKLFLVFIILLSIFVQQKASADPTTDWYVATTITVINKNGAAAGQAMIGVIEKTYTLVVNGSYTAQAGGLNALIQAAGQQIPELAGKSQACIAGALSRATVLIAPISGGAPTVQVMAKSIPLSVGASTAFTYGKLGTCLATIGETAGGALPFVGSLAAGAVIVGAPAYMIYDMMANPGEFSHSPYSPPCNDYSCDNGPEPDPSPAPPVSLPPGVHFDPSTGGCSDGNNEPVPCPPGYKGSKSN